MGLSKEQWEELCKPFHGVEIRKVRQGPDDPFWDYVLFVDGQEVWTDDMGRHEKEDMCLSRDLADFIHAIRTLAAERDGLRERLESAERQVKFLESEHRRLSDFGDKAVEALLEARDRK